MRLPFTALVRRREARVEGTYFPARLNVRPAVGVNPQQAPDPSLQGGAWGEIPSRQAKVAVVTAFHDAAAATSIADEFRAVNPDMIPGASIPWGYQQPWTERSNITVPPHVAYGTLFTDAQPTYGVM